MSFRAVVFWVAVASITVFAAFTFWEFFIETVLGFNANGDEPIAEKWSEVLFATACTMIVTSLAGWLLMRAQGERQRLASDLTENARVLEITYEAMDQGICVYDKDLRLVAWNERYIELTCQSPDGVQVGRSAFEMIKQLADKGMFGDVEMEAIAHDREQFYFRRGVATQEERRRPDGRVIDIRRNPMKDGGYVSTFTDITALKETESAMFNAKEAAEQANQAKTDFLAQMSHELRAPLNAILGFSEIITTDSDDKIERKKIRELADHVHSAGSHLYSLVNDVLDVSAIEAGRINLDEGTAHVSELIQSIVDMVSGNAEKQGVDVICVLEDGGHKLQCDPRRVSQVLLNILGNAIKFTPKGGRVDIKSSVPESGGISIVITDDGIGIPPEDLDRVVLPFEQSIQGIGPRDGVGLGLAIAKAIMEMHDGGMTIESRPASGTQVVLSFPEVRILSPDKIANGHR